MQRGLGVVATAIVLAASACSSGGRSSAPTTANPRTFPTSPVPTAGTTVVPYPLPPKSAIPDDPTDRKRTTILTCAPTSGGWTASGTLRNPTSQLAADTITVFFVVGSRTVNYAQDQIYVEPGQTGHWYVTRQFGAAKDTRCVLGGVGPTPPA